MQLQKTRRVPAGRRLLGFQRSVQGVSLGPGQHWCQTLHWPDWRNIQETLREPPFKLQTWKYKISTELSKRVWSLKEKNISHTIKCSILRKARAYSPCSRRCMCQLCLPEKLCITTAEHDTLLNKRTELVSTCMHRRKCLLSHFCPDSKD